MTNATRIEVPLSTRAAMLLRSFAIQGSWNYEILIGNGLGFCIEPALRLLRDGKGGTAYREALARQCRYFNAHPYLACAAIGALARAELDGESPERIERFRTALCGPLGSVGDRLIWAGWLPLSSLLALLAFGLGASTLTVIAVFLVVYNMGHITLRAWALQRGLEQGLRVASALGHPVLRRGPEHIARAAALCAGIALPLALNRLIGSSTFVLAGSLMVVVVGSFLIARARGRAEGWRIALGVLVVFVLYSVIGDA
jgi:PTS system mannose-specific IID component